VAMGVSMDKSGYFKECFFSEDNLKELDFNKKSIIIGPNLYGTSSMAGRFYSEGKIHLLRVAT
jgi:hypothetical protein